MADLYVPKDGVVESLTTASQSSTCAHILLASFCVHDIMQTYTDHLFENHPAISTEYVKFLATNSGCDKVVKMAEQLEVAMAKATAATEKADKAASKAYSAIQRFSELQKEHNLLLKPVKTLEDKGGR